MSVNFNDTPGPTSAHRVVTVQQLCCETILVRKRQTFGRQRLLASGRKRSSALNCNSSRLSGTSLVIFLHRIKSELRPLTFIVASLALLKQTYYNAIFFFSPFFLLNIMLQLRVHAWEAVAVLAAARMEANRGKEAELD